MLTGYNQLDGLTLNLINQTKTIFTAIAVYLVLNKKQSLPQCFALLGMFSTLSACCLLPAACCLLPAACCLLPAACCLPTPCPLSALTLMSVCQGASVLLASSGSGQSQGAAEYHEWLFGGVIPVFAASILSGVASAITQRNLQVGAVCSYSHTLVLRVV